MIFSTFHHKRESNVSFVWFVYRYANPESVGREGSGLGRLPLKHAPTAPFQALSQLVQI